MIIANYGHAKYENILLFQLYWAFEMSFLIGKHLKTELMRPIKMQQFSLIFWNKAVVCFLNSAATK